MLNCLEDNELVVYCPHCLSLNIRVIDREDESLDYCDDCGNTTLDTVDINTWEDMYQAKYGHKYLTFKNK